MRAGAGNRASPHGGRPFLTAAGTPAPAPRVMNRSSTSSAAEKAPTAMLWGE